MGADSCKSDGQENKDVQNERYKTYNELEQALRKQGLESMQMVVGFDFSGSNDYTGEKSYGKPLHGIDYINPYVHAMKILQPIIPKFDDDNIIPAYRFGCVDSRDSKVVPLLQPQQNDPHFYGFDQLIEGYYKAVSFVHLSGPTTFAPMIYQAIEIAKAYGSKQLMFLLLLTDGDVSNVELDKKAIIEASNYPISICALGLGDGPFNKMVMFDDFKGNRKFDNFQFVNFTKVEKQVKRCENPDLQLACRVFNELPDHIQSMKKLGIL